MSLISRRVLGMRVDATSYEDASWRVLRCTHEGRSAYVCVATVPNDKFCFIHCAP